MKELNHVLTLWTSSQITKFTVTERSLGVRIHSQQSVSPRRVLLPGMYLCSLHYNVVPRRKLIVLYFYGNYFRNPWKFSLKMSLSHVVEARIIEAMRKKRDKYEMLNEPCFDWYKQVTCFSQRFKHYSVYSAGLASRVPIEQLHPSLFTLTRAPQFLWKIGTKCAHVFWHMNREWKSEMWEK